MSVNMQPGGIWWNYVSGPSRLVAETANALRTGKSVYIYDDMDLPYLDSFLTLVAQAARGSEDMTLDDIPEPTNDPGGCLIARYKKQSEYRGNIHAAKFLMQQRVLRRRLIPVVARGEESGSWLEFVKAYRSASLDDGLFLLIAGQPPKQSASRYIHVLHYSDLVTEYDTLVFAGLPGNNAGRSMEMSRYITALAVALFGKNAEQAAGFALNYQIGGEPRELMAGGCLTDGEAERRIWQAQIQEIFPLIMRKTHELIDAWRPCFEAAFEYIAASRDYPNSPFPNGLRNSNDEQITAPEELEAGTIKYLMGTRRIDCTGNYTADYVLFLPDEQTRLCVDLLRELRNQLAHGKVCPAGEVERLLRLQVKRRE